MNIIFTGAQGTGKTTILNEMRNKGYEVITEVVRNLSKKGVKINKDGDERGQKKIFDEYVKLFNSAPEGFVSDRGLVDVVSYTIYLSKCGKVSEKFANKQLKDLGKFLTEHPNYVYCYFPIEFDIADDGVRDLDKEFQNEINKIILSILAGYNMSFIVISGTVEERMAKIEKLETMNKLSEELFVRINNM